MPTLIELAAFQVVKEAQECACGKVQPGAIIARKFYCCDCALQMAVDSLFAVQNSPSDPTAGLCGHA